LVREALTNVAGLARSVVACCAVVAALSPTLLAAHVARRHIPRLYPEWPLQISGSQYAPAAWADIPGWSTDYHLAAFRTFRTSCNPIVAQRNPPAD
jgi:membrane-bound lytic murein transglycosylase A